MVLPSKITGSGNQNYQTRNIDERFQSPEIRQPIRFNTPADQLRFSSPQGLQ
jgi:hypothetical protein